MKSRMGILTSDNIYCNSTSYYVTHNIDQKLVYDAMKTCTKRTNVPTIYNEMECKRTIQGNHNYFKIHLFSLFKDIHSQRCIKCCVKQFRKLWYVIRPPHSPASLHLDQTMTCRFLTAWWWYTFSWHNALCNVGHVFQTFIINASVQFRQYYMGCLMKFRGISGMHL